MLTMYRQLLRCARSYFTGVLSTLAKRTAEELQKSIADQWKWNGRSVFIVDGSSVSMPDTPKNQHLYPQPPTQAPGIGFPLAHITVLLSLATGACHDLEMAPYQGKGTGEKSLFRPCMTPSVLGMLFSPMRCSTTTSSCGNYSNARSTSWLVFSTRRGHSDRGKQPRGGHRCLAPSQQTTRHGGSDIPQLPEELRHAIGIRGCSRQEQPCQQFKVLTTMLNVSVDAQQIGDLFERRWEGEVDIRSIKCTMQMEILRCKTPEMVHKEIWTHLLAYNLLRTVMSVAAEDHDTELEKSVSKEPRNLNCVRSKDRSGPAREPRH